MSVILNSLITVAIHFAVQSSDMVLSDSFKETFAGYDLLQTPTRL